MNPTKNTLSPLEKELKTSKKSRLNEGEKVLEGVKFLMEENDSKERAILKNLGISQELNIAEEKSENVILNEQYTKEFEDDIYTLEDIEALAIKYRFYLRPSSNYRGKIPADLGPVLLRFATKHNLNVNDSRNSDTGKFYILAKPQMFSSYDTPKIKIQNFADSTKDSVKSFYETWSDPLMFYKIDSNHYKLLKIWGSNFTLDRKIIGAITKSMTSLYALHLSIMFIVLYAGVHLAVFLGNAGYFNYGNGETLYSTLLYTSMASVIIGCILFFCYGFGSLFASKKKKYSIHQFYTPYKMFDF